MAKILLTRDSVCAGDDTDSHDRTVEVNPVDGVVDFVRGIATDYLPSVAGIGHSWTVYLNGESIAVVTVEEVQPHVTVLHFEAENTLHFKYHSATH